jgi:hypothetical protein
MCLCLRILLGWLVNWLCIWIACLHRCLRAAACLLVTFVLWHCVTCVSSKQGAFWWHLFFGIASRVWAANKEPFGDICSLTIVHWRHVCEQQTRSLLVTFVLWHLFIGVTCVSSKQGALSKQANKERWASKQTRSVEQASKQGALSSKQGALSKYQPPTKLPCV